MIADTEKIEMLFSTDITDYKIAKETGITKMTVGNMRKGVTDLMKMELRNAIKLTEFWEEYIMNEYGELKDFIEDDITERDFGHPDLSDFSAEDILNGKVVEAVSTDNGPKHNRVKVLISKEELEVEYLDTYVVDFANTQVNVYYVKTK